MAGLQRADRRKSPRYRVKIVAELVSHAGERAPCTILDISPTGASVFCNAIAEHIGLRIRLDGFGEITVARLRAKHGEERLLFRDTKLRIEQFVRFLTNLVDAGAALPAFDRREDGLPARESLDRPLASLNDALLRQVDHALNFISQIAPHVPITSDNVLAFRPKMHFQRPDSPPDHVA